MQRHYTTLSKPSNSSLVVSSPNVFLHANSSMLHVKLDKRSHSEGIQGDIFATYKCKLKAVITSLIRHLNTSLEFFKMK